MRMLALLAVRLVALLPLRLLAAFASRVAGFVTIIARIPRAALRSMSLLRLLGLRGSFLAWIG